MSDRTSWRPQIVRDRIRTTSLVQALEKHALGEQEMSATRIKAAEILLRKTIPDLSAVELSGEVTTTMTREQILERLATLHAAAAPSDADRTARGDPGPPGSASTH